ncbi:MAG: hypothetical protein ACI8RT_001096 [Candidatus Azotimanducaceae bacterium]|jgi:hypothetical protein|tara:strand:+ start:334 stop:729 length:396 start_codon:yes stop_codon:yes gene_type:complete
MQQTQFRLAGAALALAAVFVLDLSQATALHKLWLPMLLAIGVYFMTFSVMAVAVSCGTLAAIHLDLNSASWVESQAYPLVVGVSALVAGRIGLQRFRQRIADTHEERWANRRGEEDATNNTDDSDDSKNQP